jgi:hypothetical protein
MTLFHQAVCREVISGDCHRADWCPLIIDTARFPAQSLGLTARV